MEDELSEAGNIIDFFNNMMPPITNAEIQKAYREGLEKKKPGKYEKLRFKQLEEVKENITKKNRILSDEDKKEIQVKWRNARAKKFTTNKDQNFKIGPNKAERAVNSFNETLQELIELDNQRNIRIKNLKSTLEQLEKRYEMLKKLVDEETSRYKAMITN